jgi:hypothetical protein
MRRKIIFLAAVLILVILRPGHSKSVGVTVVGQWGANELTDVAVQGQWAYCAAGAGGLDIIDITAANNPVEAGRIITQGSARYVAVSGNYAYVTLSGGEFQVIGISKPWAPVSLGTCAAVGNATNVVVSGNYAYIAVKESENNQIKTLLRIIDISKPAAPKVVGTYEMIGEDIDVAVSGNYAYAANGNQGLRILDISNPSAPTLAGSYQTPGRARGIAVSGNYAYVADMEQGLLEINISNPSTPVLTGSCSITGNAVDVAVSGNFAYMHNEAGALITLFIFPPGDPERVAYYNTSGHLSEVVVFGKYAYMAYKVRLKSGWDESGMLVLDISHPPGPDKVGSYDTVGYAYGVAVSGNYAYVAYDWSGFRTIDISNPAAPIQTDSYKRGEYAFETVVSGKYAYVAWGWEGLQIMDLSKPDHPSRVGSYQVSTSVETVAVSGKYVYLVSWSGTLYILDVSRPSAPVLVGQTDTGTATRKIVVSGNYAYLADRNGLEIVDISKPSAPRVVSTYSIPWLPMGVYVSGHYAYVAISNMGLNIIDISNPSAPTLVGTYNTPGWTRGVYVSGNYAYLADGTRGLQIIDVSNPQAPSLAGACDTEGYAEDVVVSGEYAYVADGDSGQLYIFHLALPAAPTLTVTSPNGGETWPAGTTQTITWTQSGLTGNVVIDLFKGGVFHSNPGTAAANSRVFSWNLPSGISPGSDYKIRIYQGSVGDYSDKYFSIPAATPPVIGLSRTSLNFGAAGGQHTRPQTAAINNSGGGTLHWTTVPTQPWLEVTPVSGTGSGTVQVGVYTAGLAKGTHTGTITVIDPAAANSPREITVTLSVYKNGGAPFGVFATPVDGATVSSSIPVTGWVLDDVEVTSVKIYRDPVGGEGKSLVYIGNTVFVEGARPDVEMAYPGYPFNYRAGWGYMMLTNFLPNSGNGTFKIHAIAEDLEGNQITLGQKTIICDNAHAVKPFGAIDTPAQGGIASGDHYRNQGWVLTPSPNMIPVDGHTIKVWIDGVQVGKCKYNIYRQDIAVLFPGYANSNGALAYFDFDTTVYDNRVHTMQWTAVDSAGNTDGIGSRYFSTQNTGAGKDKNSAPASSNDLSPKDIFPKDTSVSGISVRGGQGRQFRAELPGVAWTNLEPVAFIQGYGSHIQPGIQYPDAAGEILFTIKELERLEIHLNPRDSGIEPGSFEGSHYTGCLAVGSEYRPLPTGSTLDRERGIFCWGPGPGFSGEYPLIFIETAPGGEMNKRYIRIKIIPRFGRKESKDKEKIK